MATVRWLDLKYTNYNWQGWSELRGLRQRASRLVGPLGMDVATASPLTARSRVGAHVLFRLASASVQLLSISSV